MNTTTIIPTKKHARKIVELLSHGLVCGLGEPEPGKFCVEAAVCFALELPHGDNPKCVGSAVRSFKIALNDCAWPSNMDRANGMKALAIAQLGSNTLNQMKFGKLMFLRGTQRILSFVWRKEAEHLSKERKAEMLGWCDRMEACETFEEARKLTKDASAYASPSAYASRHELLKLTAQVGLDVLKEMKSPGCKWLSLAK